MVTVAVADPTEWVLAGCVKLKADEPRPAKDLYTSPLFQKRRRVAELRGDGWGIISAEHGYIDPDYAVAPYDTHIDSVDAEAWAETVMEDVEHIIREYGVDTVTILAGSGYTEPLTPLLEAAGVDVLTPCAGLMVGQRHQKLAELANRAENEELPGSNPAEVIDDDR